MKRYVFNQADFPIKIPKWIGTGTKMTPAYRSPNKPFVKPDNGEKIPQEQNHFGNEKGTSLHTSKKPKGLNGLAKENEKSRGEEGTNKIWQNQKQGFYYTVVEALLQVGLREAKLGK